MTGSLVPSVPCSVAKISRCLSCWPASRRVSQARFLRRTDSSFLRNRQSRSTKTIVYGLGTVKQRQNFGYPLFRHRKEQHPRNGGHSSLTFPRSMASLFLCFSKRTRRATSILLLFVETCHLAEIRPTKTKGALPPNCFRSPKKKNECWKCRGERALPSLGMYSWCTFDGSTIEI